ncbi:MAG TPA: hypothetical protein VFL66_03365 [Gaiellaceae bacterium]|nr:hypothetical protein [Gaiellaceae bacterium]
MNRVVRGAFAGAAAGVAWKALEPLLQREFGSPYSDAGIVAGFVARGGVRRQALEVAMQAVDGGLFGAAFAKLGGHGIRGGVAAGLAENAAFWPAVALIQRVHPDVRSGRWPRPFADPASIQVAFAGHALFGILLGALLDPPRIRNAST